MQHIDRHQGRTAGDLKELYLILLLSQWEHLVPEREVALKREKPSLARSCDLTL